VDPDDDERPLRLAQLDQECGLFGGLEGPDAAIRFLEALHHLDQVPPS
jgi:hypothetical protein